jgi:hypothetical protein
MATKTQEFDFYLIPSSTYPPVASMWVVTLHSLLLYSDLPPTLSTFLIAQAIFEPKTFPHINTPTFLNQVILHNYLPMKMEQTECSETSAFKIQMPENYPEESIQHSQQCIKFEVKKVITHSIKAATK